MLNLQRKRMEFIEKIKEQAREISKVIVLPEGSEERILRAAEVILKENIARIILLGDKDEILSAAKKERVNIDGILIVNPLISEKRELYAQKFYELRKYDSSSQRG